MLPRTQLRIDAYTSPADRIAILMRQARDAIARGELMPLALRAASESPGLLSRRQLAAAALRLTQTLPYFSEARDQQWFQPVSWTLAHGGSCGPLSAVLYGLCTLLGVPAEIVWLDQPGEALNHLTVRIFVDGAWYWADPSVRSSNPGVPSAVLGENPYDAVRRLGQWHVIS